MEFIDEITLTSGHANVLGNSPRILVDRETPEGLSFEGTDVESFGLFDSTPNYANYYPDVTAEDLTPKDDEFIYPVFRLLSEVIVNKQGYPADFTAPGVLKASMGMLLGQTVNVDHETAVGNAIGVITKVFWQEAYKVGNKTIPAGINGVLKIDGKSNPRLVRGIQMDPPSIHSNSVTVRFSWKKSHPDMPDEEFRYKLGEMVDNNLVRRCADKILAYFETSLVSHGADPYAQKLDETGKIINPKFATTVDSFSYKHNLPLSSVMDYKDDLSIVSLSAKPTNPINNPKTENMNLLALALALGFANTENLTDMNEDSFQSFVTDHVSSATTSLQGKITDLESAATAREERLTALETEKESFIAEIATLKESNTASARENVITLYRTVNPEADVEKDANISLINKATSEECVALTQKYQAELDAKFPLTCKCGSTEVTRATSTQSNSQGQGTTKTKEEVQEGLRRNAKLGTTTK